MLFCLNQWGGTGSGSGTHKQRHQTRQEVKAALQHESDGHPIPPTAHSAWPLPTAFTDKVLVCICVCFLIFIHFHINFQWFSTTRKDSAVIILCDKSRCLELSMVYNQLGNPLNKAVVKICFHSLRPSDGFLDIEYITFSHLADALIQSDLQ